MPFRFRLAVPLRLARARRNELRRELALALRDLSAAEEAARAGQHALDRIGAEYLERAAAGISGVELHALTAGREAARARLPGLLAHVRERAAREQEIRGALGAAAQEVSVLDRLRTEAWRRWLRDLARREQAMIDDVVLVRRARAAVRGEGVPA